MLAQLKTDSLLSEDGIKSKVCKSRHLILAWGACHPPAKKTAGPQGALQGGGARGHPQNYCCAQCNKEMVTPWKIVDQLSFCRSLCYDRYLGLV